MKNIKEIKRFWKFVKKTNSCWIWGGAIMKSGHGHFDYEGGSLAHRFSWELHKFKIPKNLCVLHDCPTRDNPSCVNPKHLWIGTKAQNNADSIKKGTFAVGESYVSRTKLNKNFIVWMRKVPKKYAYIRAMKLGVSRQTACDVLKRRTWKHIH